MAMQLGGSSGIKAEINVTPLVDVMLVLLIILMIVAPLLQQGVPVTLPIAANSSEKPETQDQTVVTIDRGKNVYLNAVPVPSGQLQSRVTTVLEDKSDKIVIIKADDETPYSAVMDTMDELRAAGIEDMGLITDTRRKSSQAQGSE
jgi:biopolymer transport protein TolR